MLRSEGLIPRSLAESNGILSWRGAVGGSADVGGLFILLLLDDGWIVLGASSETVLDQQLMQLNQRRYRHARRAESHPGADGRIQYPRRGHNDHAGCRLEVNNGSGYALLSTLTPDAAAIEGVPAILDLDLVPDVGRMTGQLLSAEKMPYLPKAMKGRKTGQCWPR